MIKKLKKMLSQRKSRENLYATSEYWDSKALEMSGNAVSMWPNNHLNRLYQNEQTKLITGTFEGIEGKKMLDIGCGVGRLSRWFTHLGASVTGIDFSDESLKIARSQTVGSNPEFVCMSMLELDEQSTYDLVFSWGSIAIACRSRDELIQVVERIHQALVPGGQVLLLEPIHKGFVHRVLDMDLSEFTQIMRNSGFEVQSVTELHFWPMRFFLAYLPWPNSVTNPLYHLGQLFMKLPGLKALGDYKGIHASRVD